MTDFLEQVIAERRADVARAKRERSIEELLHDVPDNAWTRLPGSTPAASHGPVRGGAVGNAFDDALRRHLATGHLAVIAETKRLSPAHGQLATPALSAADQALRYEAGGAVAISVLTESRHWGGSLDDLAAVRAVTSLPLLCKDVIVDEYQIAQARAAGADAVLLIAEALSDEELRHFRQRAAGLFMGTLVEAHESAAFGRAVACGSLVVGVNARDLRAPQNIDIGRARQLHTFVKAGQIFVAESGIGSADDVLLLPARVDAVLVGTALMRAADPATLIRQLSTVKRAVTA